MTHRTVNHHAATTTARGGAAQRLAPLLAQVLGTPLPVRLRAWDGSETGPATAPRVTLRSRRGLRRLLWQPGELGLAQAYIAGELDVEGDLTDSLRAVWRTVRERRLAPPRPGPRERARAAAVLLRLGVLGPPPPPPGHHAKLRGTLHSKERDRAAISHHYDLSGDFYALLLDDSMAYSCGYWRRPEDPGYTLADAQYDKAELVCRKLALEPGARSPEPGARLLDIGCGWGTLALHAAAAHKVQVTAVTLAAEQAEAVRRKVRERGLEDLVEVQLCHYRDIRGGQYDAVATVEMGEHVGEAYPEFAATLHGMLRPRGRLLVQQMSGGANAPGGGAFIETYIAPDMTMRALGETVSLLENAGLEVRATESLREDYVRTIGVWQDTLDARRQDAVDFIGPTNARVWQLYLAGGRLAFEERRMGVDQILAVRPTDEGDSGMGHDPGEGTVR